MANWCIEPLERSHQRDDFSCGKPALDDFLRAHVSQYEKRKLGRTYVIVRPGEKLVQGYYTLAASTVTIEHLPASLAKKLPKHPVPVVLLARMAVDQSVQGKGPGELLLFDALRRCLDLEKALGIHAVEVDAIDDHARAFYVKYGFTALSDNPLHLILPLTTAASALP